MNRTIPIIALRGTLIVSIQVELTDRLVIDLREDVAQEIQHRNVTGLVIEVSGVDVLDSYIARSIRGLAQVARLMGVRTVVAGLDAGMAITLVEMGMSMEGVETALALENALDLLASAESEAPNSNPTPDDPVPEEVLDHESWQS